MKPTHEFNAKNLVKYNSKIKNLIHAKHIISLLQDYAIRNDLTELEARSELFINGNDIKVARKNSNTPSIIEEMRIDAKSLEVTYHCYTGISEVDSINGDYAYTLVANMNDDLKAMNEYYYNILNAHSDYLDNN